MVRRPGHAYRSGWLGTAQPSPGDTYAHETSGHMPMMESRRSRYAQASTGWLGTAKPAPGDTYATGQAAANGLASTFAGLPPAAHYLMIGAGVFSLATIMQSQPIALRLVKGVGVVAGLAAARTLYYKDPAPEIDTAPPAGMGAFGGKWQSMGPKYKSPTYALSQRIQPLGA